MGRINKLIKIMFLASGILLFHDASFAQQRSALGIRGGSNTASGTGERDIFNGNNLRGYHFGFYTYIGVSDFFAIQPEFLFSRRSYVGPRGQYVVPGTDLAFPFYRHNFDYLDVPVFLRFNLVRGLHLLAGPQFSNRLGSQQRYIGYGGREFIQSYRGAGHFDLSGVLGIGYEFRHGLSLGIRYGYGIGRIHSLWNFDRMNVPHQTQGMFTVGYTLGGRVNQQPARRDLYIE